jgi:transposase
MAHIHKKIKKGRPYYYLRETARVDGKPKVVNQVYLGSPERLLELAKGAGSREVERIQVQEFGSLWLAELLDREINIAGLVDSLLPPAERKGSPSVGDYFFYAIANRMVAPKSKRALAEWYRTTAIQQIRPVALDALNSQAYWKQWEKMDSAKLAVVADLFFRKLAEREPSSADAVMFDTTNYYTFMAGNTSSELAQRGRNKEGRHWLRQVGVALLVARDNRLPLFYREYEGNRHDSRVFLKLAQELFEVAGRNGQGTMTIVFDKGINAEENIAAIDANDRLHFVTSYSPHYAEDLIHVDRKHFQVVDTAKNRQLKAKGREDDLLLAWRTSRELWGRERHVVVTYNPRTATKQRYAFEQKMLRLEEEVHLMRHKVNGQAVQWRNPDAVRERYLSLCRELHLPDDLYLVELYRDGKRLRMNCRKNHYRIGRHLDYFGKNILVTDHPDWSTDEIVQAGLDRYVVEQSFRQSKDHEMVAMLPLRHWTDGKIRCHILTCVVALAYLRLLEIRLARNGLRISAAEAMESMRTLHSCLLWPTGARKAQRRLEEPNEKQAAILQALGYKVVNGVLRSEQE